MAGTSAAPATDGLNPTTVWNATAVKKNPPLMAKYTSAVAALAPENCREPNRRIGTIGSRTVPLDRHEHGDRDQREDPGHDDDRFAPADHGDPR